MGDTLSETAGRGDPHSGGAERCGDDGLCSPRSTGLDDKVQGAAVQSGSPNDRSSPSGDRQVLPLWKEPGGGRAILTDDPVGWAAEEFYLQWNRRIAAGVGAEPRH